MPCISNNYWCTQSTSLLQLIMLRFYCLCKLIAICIQGCWTDCSYHNYLNELTGSKLVFLTFTIENSYYSFFRFTLMIPLKLRASRICFLFYFFLIARTNGRSGFIHFFVKTVLSTLRFWRFYPRNIDITVLSILQNKIKIRIKLRFYPLF